MYDILMLIFCWSFKSRLYNSRCKSINWADLHSLSASSKAIWRTFYCLYFIWFIAAPATFITAQLGAILTSCDGLAFMNLITGHCFSLPRPLYCETLERSWISRSLTSRTPFHAQSSRLKMTIRSLAGPFTSPPWVQDCHSSDESNLFYW